MAFYSARNVETGCLEWTGSKHNQGYGKIWDGQRVDFAHRLAWALANGPIPEGMCVCHKCDNPACVAVDHLFLGTMADNMADKKAKGRARSGGHLRKGIPSSIRGEKHPKSKITAAQAQAIFRDTRATATIARQYGISWSLVRGIKLRRNWRHATETTRVLEATDG